MAQAERTGYIEAAPHQLTRQQGGGLLMAAELHHRVGRLVPDVGARLQAIAGLERLDDDFVQCEDAERRQQVQLKVLVLVVAPDKDDIGLEFVERAPRRAEGFYLAGAVAGGSASALVVAPFLTHTRWPVLRISQVGWSAVAVERPPQDVGHISVGELQVWCVRAANPK